MRTNGINYISSVVQSGVQLDMWLLVTGANRTCGGRNAAKGGRANQYDHPQR